MNLYIKQKVFSFGDKFNVYDFNGNIKYFAEGEIFTLGKKLHVYDINNREIIYIRKKLMTFLPKYEVSVFNGPPVEVIKNFTLLRHEYSIPEWGVNVHGNFFAHEYTVERNGVTVAQMAKEWLTWGDTYGINVYNPDDELMVLAVILVIDCCMESNNGK